MTTQLMIGASRLIHFNDAVNAARAEKNALCKALLSLPEPLTYDQNHEFNQAMEVAERKFQDACWALALEVSYAIEEAQVNS